MRTLALVGALLLGVATLPSAADAAIIISNGKNGDGPNTESCSGTGSAASCTSTVITTPNSLWKSSVGQGAQWVSWAQTGANPVQTTNLSTMTISESFTLGAASALSINALADDRADVKILDSLNNTVYSFNSSVGGNGPCNLAVMGCIDANQLRATTAVLAAGIYTFVITAIQTNDSSFGVNYSVDYVPLPGAVLLFGSALAGLGVMRRRKSGAAVTA